jgi:transforming growth factor-beta-induced protein
MKRIAMLLGAAALVLAIVPTTLAASKPTQTIVQIATANGNFKTLLAAVGCADPAVGAALTSGKQLTVFAPTDAAFAAAQLDATSVCKLPTATLTKILLYHVVSGDAFAKDVLPAKAGQIRGARTLLGQRVWAIYNGTLFTTSGTTAHVDVKDKLFDIRATNGVIHVIDAVLMPSM